MEPVVAAVLGHPAGDTGRQRRTDLLPWFEPEITPPVLEPGVRRHHLDEADRDGHVRGVIEAQMMAMSLHSGWMQVDVDTIHATGGASANREILQVMADVFAAQVFQFEVGNSAALGAALRAAEADAAARGHRTPWEEIVKGLAEPIAGSRIAPYSGERRHLPGLQDGLRRRRGAGARAGAGTSVIAYPSAMRSIRFWLMALTWIACAAPAGAESGTRPGCGTPRIVDAATLAQYDALPSEIVLLGSAPVLQSSRDELARGLGSMLGRTFKTGAALGGADAIVVGTAAALRGAIREIAAADLKTPGAFYLRNDDARASASPGDCRRRRSRRLYGAFAFLRRVAMHLPVAALDERQAPQAPLRWVNEWNNLDGTIERGYGGRSIFFERRPRPRRI